MSGPRNWREAVEDPELAAEMFPSLAGMLRQPTDRRRVLKLMAASMALAGLSGCAGSRNRHLIPAVVAPPGIIPGLPNYYATASVADGSALGIVVRHMMGRPVKIEGNPHHPSSLGATDALAQAVLLDFYDPDRSVGIENQNQLSDQDSLRTALLGQRTQIAASHGAGFRILTGTVYSPSQAAVIADLLRRYPQARWHQWEPFSRDAARAGAALAYGRPVDMKLHLDRADVVLALQSDLLQGAPGHVRYGRELTSRRNPTRATMSRIYAVESSPSLLGAQADHRFPASPREIHDVLLGLAAHILGGGTAPPGAPPWLAPAVADLQQAQGRALILAGPELDAQAHALVHAMNEKLGARGQTFEVIEPALPQPAIERHGLEELQEDMRAGRVDTLLVLDSNPVFTAPGFADAMRRVRFSLCAAQSPNETAQAATWFVPLAHPFEAWGDARAHDGTATIMQPQSLPLYGARGPLYILGLFASDSPPGDLARLRQTWQQQLSEPNAWREALATGVIPDTASRTLDVALRPEAAQGAPPAPARGLSVLFRPDPYLLDGRHANNPWLEELPRPFTKLTWDNPLLISPQAAGALGLANGDEAVLWIGDRSLTLPVWVMPGQAADVVVAHAGFGRWQVGEVGAGAGWDVFPLRGAQGAARLVRGKGHRPLASTDHRDDPLEGSFDDIVHHGTLAAFHRDPTFLKKDSPADSLYRRVYEAPVQWGMSVDLNLCIGCNACVTACQAENNVPVVGREGVLRGREMFWLRIDRYWTDDVEYPDTYFQPMLCQHCEEAPCEVVCPFGATVHDQEGINTMIYNRCVGTRFCSNNCPYKVRRFNYADYAGREDRLPISRNPEVSVRGRGVMEKCTFCIQRVAEARIAHDRDGVPERAVTACQAACPTQVFTFGNVADPASEVSTRKQSPLDYAVLPDRGTHPRVTYEARIRNPNPAIGA